MRFSLISQNIDNLNLKNTLHKQCQFNQHAAPICIYRLAVLRVRIDARVQGELCQRADDDQR